MTCRALIIYRKMDYNQIIDEIIFIIKDNAVLLAAILFIALMVLWGSRRGLMVKLLSLCSVVTTLAIELKVYPAVLLYIKSSEGLSSFLSELGMKLIGGAIGTAAAGMSDTAGTTGGIMSGMGGGALSGAGTGGMTGSDMSQGMSITESPLYDMLGLDVLADNAAAAVGDIAAKIVCFIGIFILIRLAVKLLFLIAKGLKSIHLIAWADGFFGGIFGFFEGIVYLWLFMFVISGFPAYSFCRYVLTQISRDALLTMLYRQNLIMQFFAGMLR